MTPFTYTLVFLLRLTSALVITRPGATEFLKARQADLNSLGCAPLSALLPSVEPSPPSLRRQTLPCWETCTDGLYEYSAVADGGAECICTNVIDASQFVAQNTADGTCPSGYLKVMQTGLTPSTTPSANSIPTSSASNTTVSPRTSMTPSVDTSAPTTTPSNPSMVIPTLPVTMPAATPSPAAYDTIVLSISETDSTAFLISISTVSFTPQPTPSMASLASSSDTSVPTSASESQATLSTDTLTPTLTSSPIPTSTQTSLTPSYSDVGCYAEPLPHNPSMRALTNYSSGPQSDLTIESCISTCAGLDYPLAGVEAGDLCFCGVGLYHGGAPAPFGNCSHPCSGNPSEACGGAWLFELYVQDSHLQELFHKLPQY